MSRASSPSGLRAAAWATTGVLAVGAGVFFWSGSHWISATGPLSASAALVFDTAVIWAYALVFYVRAGHADPPAPVLPCVEAALRYGLLGGLMSTRAGTGAVAIEWWRSDHFAPSDFTLDSVTFPLGLQLLMGAIIGWLVNTLAR